MYNGILSGQDEWSRRDLISLKHERSTMNKQHALSQHPAAQAIPGMSHLRRRQVARRVCAASGCGRLHARHHHASCLRSWPHDAALRPYHAGPADQCPLLPSSQARPHPAPPPACPAKNHDTRTFGHGCAGTATAAWPVTMPEPLCCRAVEAQLEVLLTISISSSSGEGLVQWRRREGPLCCVFVMSPGTCVRPTFKFTNEKGSTRKGICSP